MTTTENANRRPLGATDGCPLVVSTADLARFINRRLESKAIDRLVTDIKNCKERGAMLTSVSNDVIKKISQEKLFVTADNCAEAILISQGEGDQLGKEIPLYRNPFLEKKSYISSMKKRLYYGWDDEVDGVWDEKEQLDYILSFPSITPS